MFWAWQSHANGSPGESRRAGFFEIEITEGQTGDIRVDGRFTEKISEVRAFVSEVLGNVMEDFDSSGYA